MDQLLDINGLAEYLNVPRTWVRDQVTARKIPHTHIGRHVRFTQEHVAQIIAAGEQPAMNAPRKKTRVAAA